VLYLWFYREPREGLEETHAMGALRFPTARKTQASKRSEFTWPNLDVANRANAKWEIAEEEENPFLICVDCSRWITRLRSQETLRVIKNPPSLAGNSEGSLIWSPIRILLAPASGTAALALFPAFALQL
jgi:hypothetical protein